MLTVACREKTGNFVDCVGPGLDIHFAPGEAEVGMVPLLLGHGAHAVHEIERRPEVREGEVPGQVMTLHHLPTRHLVPHPL
jgi:hypothetical protein